MSGEAIIIINGQFNKNYLIGSLKKQGFLLINLVTSPSKINSATMFEQKDYYDSVVTVQNSIPETLESLKQLFQTKNYSFAEILTTQQMDIELADIIREFFGKPANGEVFRSLNRDKTLAVKQLNKALLTDVETPVVSVEEFATAISQQSLPCSVKVLNLQQNLATYVIEKPADIELIVAKLNAYKTADIKLYFQPYHQNLYRLQTTSFANEALVVALWHEKTAVREGVLWEDVRILVDTAETEILSQDKLVALAHQLTKVLHLNYGVGEFVLAFDKNKVLVLDYNLAIQNPNQIEVMERAVGYSPVSCYLRHSALIAEVPISKKEFKNIVVVNLLLNSKNDLLKLSMLPTFYRYYSDKTKAGALPITGELYLAHKNKNLLAASFASIRNTERLLLNPQFISHSATNIVDFYRQAATNKKDYTISQETIVHSSLEEKEALKNLSHEGGHIPRFIRPLSNTANIQDIMRYYIDIYDLYILHGKPPGTKMTPMNTGNPAFLPFPPIVKALRKSLQENLLSYARYSMQVPESAFVDKLAKYCQEEKIITSQQKLQTNNVVIGHGSTNVYYLALKSVIKNKGDIVLITRPTYGLFIDPVYTAGGDVGFVDLKEGTGWKVQPQNLHETIHFYNEKAFNDYILTTFLKEYQSFLHAQEIFNLEENETPPMPNLEAITKLKIFDTYIAALNTYIDGITDPLVNKDGLKFSFPPRVRAFYHMNPHNPTGAVYTKQELEALAEIILAHPDIYVIDDLAHWGVLYGTVEPATFASLNRMFEKTLTLISLSKAYCVPGLRAGVAIGKTEIISEMHYRLLNSSSSATLPAMIALNAVVDAPKKEREDYLHSNSQEYLFRRDLMGALVNGVQKTEMTFSQKIRVYQLILENEAAEKPVDKKLLKLILSGMPLVRTLTQPQGCFFHLLDISKLIGANVGHVAPLQTSTDVRNAIYSICNIDTVPGEMSANFFNYSLRMSFSLAPQQIYSACKNIHLFIGNYIIKHNPDILAKNHFVEALAFKSMDAEVVEEDILNKALVRLYLNKGVQSLTTKHSQLFTSNYLQNKPKLQTLVQRINDLTILMEKILEPSLIDSIHKEIYDYLGANEGWLQNYLPDVEQLKIANQAALIAPINNAILSRRNAKRQKSAL